MEFLGWYYTKGLDFYIQSWLSQVTWVFYYFSPFLLLKTLFAPWKRLIVVDRKPGFSFQRFFEVVSFNLISRGIGAVVRFILFCVSLILIVLTFLGGAVGLIFWLLIPLFGLPIFSRVKKSSENFLKDLVFKIKYSEKEPLDVILSSEAGVFLTRHIGIDKDKLLGASNTKNIDFSKVPQESFAKLIGYLLRSGVWSQDFLRENGLTEKDLIIASSWWDDNARSESYLGDVNFARPSSIGLELLFGYTPTLDQYSVDLSLPQSFSHRLIGREQIVSRMERVLTSGNSIILVGQPGVGKKTVVLEFARRAATGQLGQQMAYKRVLELDYNSFLSIAQDLNEKKAMLSTLLEEASSAGNIILMVRDIQRLTNPEVEGYDFTDIFEAHLERRELKIIAVTTNSDYERFIVPNLRLRKYMETIEVIPPSKEEAMEILVESAQRWESRKAITFLTPALRKMLDESDKYITETPFPEKVLELLDSIVSYAEKESKKTVGIDEVNAVLAEKTGISFARLNQEEKTKLSNLEKIIHERLINQDHAVSLIARSLRAKTLGTVESSRPIGSFLFLGPTGVGKTETAKVLARVYYGSEENILRFDMAEYAGREGLEMLIGSQERNIPGRLTTAIKNRPASLLLLDEIEKASPEIFNLFLSLLDEGMMTDAFGKKINGRHLFIIGTSNAGAEHVRKLVKDGVKGDRLQEEVLEYILEKGIFTPEFLNRFDGVVVYEPLGRQELIRISEIMLSDLAEKLKAKGIYLEINRKMVEKLANDGFDPAFGARPMRRIVDLVLGDLIGKALLSGEVKAGDRITILPGLGKEEYSIKRLP